MYRINYDGCSYKEYKAIKVCVVLLYVETDLTGLSCNGPFHLENLFFT